MKGSVTPKFLAAPVTARTPDTTRVCLNASPSAPAARYYPYPRVTAIGGHRPPPPPVPSSDQWQASLEGRVGGALRFRSDLVVIFLRSARVCSPHPGVQREGPRALTPQRPRQAASCAVRQALARGDRSRPAVGSPAVARAQPGVRGARLHHRAAGPSPALPALGPRPGRMPLQLLPCLPPWSRGSGRRTERESQSSPGKIQNLETEP